jgi:hypothetical protein
MAKAFIVRIDVPLDDPRTGEMKLHPRGSILAHPAHIAHLEGSRHHAAHGHFVELPEDHPAVAAHRTPPEMPQPAKAARPFARD